MNKNHKYMPEISGPWRELFQPQAAGTYINDHCVYHDPKGDWHLVGITSEKPDFGRNEYWFAHGVTSSPDKPMRELDALFKGWPDDGLKYAPDARWDGDTLHMFAGPGKIRHFTSKDGYNFEFEGIVIDHEWPLFRDTMNIQLDDGTWLMYATDWVDNQDAISAWRSKDLYKWEHAGTVFKAVAPAPVWAPISVSACESPFVIKMDDGYYLSVCLTNHVRGTYLNTLIFFSPDPLDFGVYAAGGEGETAKLVTRLETHAAEFVLDQEANWWITCCGWTGLPRPEGCKGGKAGIAPLTWKKQ